MPEGSGFAFWKKLDFFFHVKRYVSLLSNFQQYSLDFTLSASLTFSLLLQKGDFLPILQVSAFYGKA